ncbi:MAG: PAS domain-containing protein [Nitrospiraceae bacterium]|nr:MAG: PAS domain-containing protein [Nitrospiraceae bacterium]
MKVKQEEKVAEKKTVNKRRVLLIEDTNTQQMALKQLTREKKSRYEYIMAGSIEEARDLVETGPFDVIITDFMLRDGTVFTIFETIKDIPVIIVTEGGDEGIAVKAMKAGAYDYIIKDPELNYLKVLPVTIDNAIQRKEFEERLRLLESAVLSANDAIIILEAEPGEMMGRRILYVNDAFTRMTGYTIEEATKSTLRMLRGPRTSLEALNKIRLALESRRPVRVELINYRKDGSEFWVECNIVPFADEKGSFVHWVSVQRDITERKIAEVEREKLIKEIEAMNVDLTELNQELETIGAERTMSLMALTVADRIRNPATMIGGRCRRILKKDNLPEDLMEGLQQIMDGAEKLDRIVKDFETLLKERQYKFKHHDLNSIVEKLVHVIEKEAAVKGVKITVRISRDPLRLNMQKDLLRMAIFHVMKNAVEATSKNGKIDVETSKQHDKVILTITDTGYGIPEGEIDNVFKPFFSTKERGFGLGLPLVKQIVSEHLGDLVIESKAGKGSVFKLIFPTTWR